MSHFAVLDHVIQQAGIQPRCRLWSGDADKRMPVFDAETWYYQSPSGRSRLLARHVSYETPGPLTVELYEPGHVYDLRAHQAVADNAAFSQPFPPGRMQVYGIYPYRIEGVDVAVDSAAVRPGGSVTIKCQVKASQGTADLHALRVAILGPDGQPLPGYDEILLTADGKAEIALPLALNQPSGRHVVRVMELAGGQTAEAAFTVGQPER
jgi:hypothetical protein